MMFAKFDAELWTFDPDVDPPCMRQYDQFGHWIFVYRNPYKDRINRAWYEINKETIVIDPGVNIFETIYIKGTGDVFYVGEGLGSEIRYHLRYSSTNLQKERDKEVNKMDSVIEKNRDIEDASRILYGKVFLLHKFIHRSRLLWILRILILSILQLRRRLIQRLLNHTKKS
jgi:hypothetical protein